MIVAPGSSFSTGSARMRQELVAPDHPALAVDRADPVAVAVEGEAEVELLLGDQRSSGRREFFSSVGSG